MALNRDVLKGWPPGGWPFYQPETDWHAPGPLQFTFTQQVGNIIAMRKANPAKNLPTDEAAVAAELEAYTEARLSATYSRHGIKKFLDESEGDKKKGSSSIGFSAPRSRQDAALVEGAKGDLATMVAGVGAGLSGLASWLGEGGVPISRDQAEERAFKCARGGKDGAPCPANQGGWLRILTAPAIATVKRLLALKHQMRLETARDSELQSCGACQCVLTLKVWQPLEFVKEGTSKAVLAKHKAANAECWVVKELERA